MTSSAYGIIERCVMSDVIGFVHHAMMDCQVKLKSQWKMKAITSNQVKIKENGTAALISY